MQEEVAEIKEALEDEVNRLLFNSSVIDYAVDLEVILWILSEGF